MASQPGGQYVFSVPTNEVNLQLSADSSFPPATALFDIAVYTTSPGPLPPDYEGTAVAPGGTLVNNFLNSASLTLGVGDYQVNDFGGSDTITAGSGNQTIVGGVLTTIVGGTGALNVIAGDRDVVLAQTATSVTVNALVNTDPDPRGEVVSLGAGPASVFSAGNDTINSGSGGADILFVHSPADTITSFWSAIGTGTGNYQVFTDTDTITGSAASVNMVSHFPETVNAGATAAVTINVSGAGDTAEALPQMVNLGAGGATVYADAGDTINAGSGAGIIVLQTDEVLSVTGAAAPNITITSAAGPAVVGATAAHIIGAAGDTIAAGAGSQTINGAKAGTDNERIVVFGDSDSVFAGDNDTIGIGGTTGSELWLDSSVTGGANGADSVGYGTFLTTGSTAQVTVGTVAGGAAAESFDTAEDYIFFPGANAQTVIPVLASAAAVDVGGVASLQLTLPDGTTMTLVGLGVTDLANIVFKPAPA